MNTTTKKANLLGLPQSALETFFTEMGEKPFRARQVLKWIHQRGITDFDRMTDLSKQLRASLERVAEVDVPKTLSRKTSVDGTIKWLFESGSGQAVETVFIPEPGRGTLCISSQVGCALDCAFCATGAQGFNRNLTSAEIIGQVWHANKELPPRDSGERAVTNVVFMGMGEPLANYRSVLPALDLLLSDYAYGLSRRRVTVSTSGLVPHIDRLGIECNVSLAVSLHAPNDELRDRLVPINKVHAIAELLDAMLKGVTDSLAHADQLYELLKQRPAKVNLIPFNPFDGNEFARSDRTHIGRFQNRLRQKGLVVTTRKTRGEDIDAACGQLAGKVSDRTRTRLREKTMRMATA
ncbi:MAG: 23S rRNA (adenine(2503)-C(2))-methyltransferase RlmN [Woeseiaceae bacterium]